MCAIREECRMRKISDSYSERLNLELLEKREPISAPVQMSRLHHFAIHTEVRLAA